MGEFAEDSRSLSKNSSYYQGAFDHEIVEHVIWKDSRLNTKTNLRSLYLKE